MTVRTYALKLSTCIICLEPHQECSTVSVGLQVSVEGAPLETFAVCESCVRNMAKPFSQPPAPPPFITDHIREQLRLARSVGLGQAADVVAEAARAAVDQGGLCGDDDFKHAHGMAAQWLRKAEAKIREMK